MLPWQVGFRRLPRRLQRIVAAELSDPESREVIIPLLERDDPEKAVAGQLSNEIAEAVYHPEEDETESGLGKRKKKRGFKRIVKNVKRIKKKTGKVLKKIAPALITAAGAVLAPFTGGASLAASSLITTGYSVARKKKEARKIEKANRREARRLEAEAKAEEKRIESEADDLYRKAPDVFAAAGVTPEMWSQMKLEEKLGAIEKINRGERVASPEEAASAPVAQELEEAAPEEMPSEAETTGESVAAGVRGEIIVLVEGKPVAKASTAEEAARAALEKSAKGDRIEILDAQSRERVGPLRVRTERGVIDVPGDLEDKVKSMSREDLARFVEKGEQAASEKKSSGVPWWLILAGGGAAAAAFL